MRWLCLTGTKSLCHDHTYKTINRWRSVDALLTLIPTIGQWPCCCLFCLWKLPICRFWLMPTKSLFNYHTYRTKNHWHSIDAHSQYGAVSMMQFHLAINAGNMSVVPNSNQITIQLPYLQQQKSLMLRWSSFSEWGCHRIANLFAYKLCQYIGYA